MQEKEHCICNPRKISVYILSYQVFSSLTQLVIQYETPLQEFWLLLWCWTNQVPVKQTELLCSLSEKAVRQWFEKFRYHLPEDQVLLESMVQLYEDTLGEERGMHSSWGNKKEPEDLRTIFYLTQCQVD